MLRRAAGLAALALVGCAAVERPAAQQAPGAAATVAFSSIKDWNLKGENLSPRGDHPLHTPLRPGFRYVLESEDPTVERRVEVVVLEETEPFDVPGIGRFECAVVQTDELRAGVFERQVQEWFAIDRATHGLYTFGAVTWEIDSTGTRVFSSMWRVGDDDEGRSPEPALVAPGRWVRGERHRSAARGSGEGGFHEVMESGFEVTVPAGTFPNSVRIREVSLADTTRFNDRWWSPGVGLARDRSDGALVASDAVRSDMSAFGRHHRKESAPRTATRITPERAREIALQVVPGEFRNVVIERRGNIYVYTVEIIASKDGVETDVFVDIATGKVVATER